MIWVCYSWFRNFPFLHYDNVICRFLSIVKRFLIPFWSSFHSKGIHDYSSFPRTLLSGLNFTSCDFGCFVRFLLQESWKIKCVLSNIWGYCGCNVYWLLFTVSELYDKHLPRFPWMAVDSMPIPVAARSKAWVSCRLSAGILGSNPAGAWMTLPCECCVLLSRGLCVGLITRPEESYRVWCV
jgi:hypothetical protein